MLILENVCGFVQTQKHLGLCVHELCHMQYTIGNLQTEKNSYSISTQYLKGGLYKLSVTRKWHWKVLIALVIGVE